MLLRLELSEQDHRELIACCFKHDIIFMSSPFEEQSADLLEKLGVEVFKVPSGEITNTPFLIYLALKGKPMVVSTGMSTLDEVKTAIKAIENAGNSYLSLLHCVSNYPAKYTDANLRAMKTMEEVFKVPVGFSDHTCGIEIALAAVALGACIIEKHFTLDRKLPGPDHQASLIPTEFKDMVTAIRNVESAMGHGQKIPADSELETALVARKSLVAARDIKAETVLTEEMISIKRPGSGLPPKELHKILGRRVREFIPSGTVLLKEMLQ